MNDKPSKNYIDIDSVGEGGGGGGESPFLRVTLWGAKNFVIRDTVSL